MPNKKIQVLFIHGGMTFKNSKDYYQYLKTRKVSLTQRKYWSADPLTKALGNNFEIIRPRMPLQENAKYKDWKISFERYVTLLNQNSILIGSSLGGIFLAKYLSENKFPKKLLGVYLVCPPYDDVGSTEDLVGGFNLNSNLSKLDNCSKNVRLLFSQDDEIVPPSNAKKYATKLKQAKIFILKNKNGHFGVDKLPELSKLILQDIKNK